MDCKQFNKILERIENSFKEDDNKWFLKITREVNGYALEGRFGDNFNKSKILIEDVDVDTPCTDYDDSEMVTKTMKKLLYEVKEYFGCYHSKHDDYNLKINVEENKD